MYLIKLRNISIIQNYFLYSVKYKIRTEHNMGYVRIILAGLFLVLFLVPGLLVYAVFALIGCFDKKLKEHLCYAFVQWGFRVVLFICGCKVEVTGAENLRADTGVVYAGNHRSIFDIVSFTAVAPPIMGFLAKKQSTSIPLLEIWMNAIHCLLLDRDDIRQGMETILKGIEEVKNGYAIFVFPEGTRNRTEEPLLPFHAATFRIATKSGVPVIPVTFRGTEDIFEPHFPKIVPHTIRITVGEPIETKDRDRKSLLNVPAEAEAAIREAYLKE